MLGVKSNLTHDALLLPRLVLIPIWTLVCLTHRHLAGLEQQAAD